MKKTFALLLALIMVLSLAACGKDEPSISENIKKPIPSVTPEPAPKPEPKAEPKAEAPKAEAPKAERNAFCIGCGKAFTDNSDFCINCGTKRS